MNRIIKSSLSLSFAYFAGISALPAAVLITVDVSDPTAVVFTATAELSSRDDSSRNLLDGVSLMNFIPGTSNYGDIVSGSLAPVGTPAFDFFNFIDAENTDFPTAGRDLSLFSSSGASFDMVFETAGPAFSGSTIVDFTDAAITLPTVGTVGEIRPGVGLLLNDSIGTFEVIPEPSSSLLLLSSICGYFLIRRR